jgi:hypothetical protein
MNKRTGLNGMAKGKKAGAREKPISLSPLKFDDAIGGLLAVKPTKKPAAKKKAAGRKKG